MRKVLGVVALLALAGSTLAQDLAKRVKAEDATWTEHPLFKGVQYFTMVGDPTKEGVAVVRYKLPPNFKIAPHTHPSGEVITVMSGTFGFGVGDTFDAAKLELLKAGAVVAQPANQPHFVWVGEEGAIIQIQVTGPAGIAFANPADDPRKK